MARLNPYLEVIIAATIWGMGGAFIKIIDLPATSLAFIRCAIPIVLIGIYFLIKKIQPFHGNLKMMMGASFLNAIRIYLFAYGFLIAPISQGVVLLYSWPIFATIYAVFFLKESVSLKKAGLLFLAFGGIVVLYSGHEFSMTSDVFIGLSAILLHSAIYAMTFVMFKKEIQNYSNIETIFHQLLIGAFLFAPFIFINDPLPTNFQWGMSFLYGTLLGVVSFGLLFSAMKKLDTATISLLCYLEAFVMIVIGLIFFDEALTINLVIGALMILTSTALLTAYKNKL